MSKTESGSPDAARQRHLAVELALTDVMQLLPRPDFERRFPKALVGLREATLRDQDLARSCHLTRVLGPSGIRWYATTLRDGTDGFLQRRSDDCFQAAIASCAGIAPWLVPDLKLERKLADEGDPEAVDLASRRTMKRWEERTGVALRVHATPPRSARRWIGVISSEDGDHCLLMAGRTCIFNPTSFFPLIEQPLNGFKWNPSEIEYGITIE